MNDENCANCSPGSPCRLHRVVADGGVVRVPLAMMDSMQRELADRAIESSDTARILDAKTMRNQAQLDEIERNAARRQAYADHYQEQAARRERQATSTPRDRAYSEMVDSLIQRG